MPDLFAIHCTTCKTRLRVRDAAVVGQILACPKCSSMVLVEAPPGWAPPLPGEASPASESNGNGAAHGESTILKKPSTTPAASRPTTRASAPPAAAPAVKPSGSNPSSLRETVSDSHFADVEKLFGSPAAGPAIARVAEGIKAKPKDEPAKGEKLRNTPAPPPPAELAGAPAVPAAIQKPAIDPVPARTRRVRMVALLVIGGLMGISLALSAAYFAVTWNTRSREIAESSPETSAPDSGEAPVDPAPPEPSDPTDDPPPNEEPMEPAPPGEPTEKPAEAASSQPARDPLDIVNDTPRDDADDPADLKKLQQQFKGLDNDAGPAPATSEEPATEPAPPPEGPETPSSRSRPEPRKVDLAKRLTDSMLEAQFTGQELQDVLQVLSGFSTIPITLDPDALPWSKITPAAPVHIHLKDTTCEEVLTEVLKPFRLEALKLEDQIVVTRSPALRKIKCPVDDLTGGDSGQQQQLMELITALAAPQSWKSAGGLGSLTPQGNDLLVENTELAYGEVLHVCERLRQARGGRTKSVFPAELFALERRTARAAAKLDQPLTLNFGQPTQLVKILHRFAEETGTQIVVDWQAAGEIGWPPDADATVTLNKTPLGEALDKLLSPMDLTFRVIDATTLQVTTRQALERKPEIEAYQAEDLAATPEESKALLERIEASLGGTPMLRWDARSHTLLALLPQPQQEKLARLLDQWREEATAK